MTILFFGVALLLLFKLVQGVWSNIVYEKQYSHWRSDPIGVESGLKQRNLILGVILVAAIMTGDTQIADYLAQGGKLSSPDNAPARYRGELMRLMSTFVDSELAGAAGFADCINGGPGIKERIAAARIVLEKLDHARQARLPVKDGLRLPRKAETPSA